VLRVEDGYIVLLHCLLLSASAVEKNQELEFERNKERFLFLKVIMLSLCYFTF